MRKSYVEYSDTDHGYWIDGSRVMGVTEILSRAGYIDSRWFDDLSRWRGSEIHRLVMLLDQNGKLDMRTVCIELRGYVRGWQQYKLDSHIIGFEAIEQKVFAISEKYAGRLDRAYPIILLDGGLKTISELTDLKTNKQGYIADWTRLQTAAYGHALRPGFWWPRKAVCLRPNGTYKCAIYPASNFQNDLAEFFEAHRKAKRTQ